MDGVGAGIWCFPPLARYAVQISTARMREWEARARAWRSEGIGKRSQRLSTRSPSAQHSNTATPNTR